MTIATAAALAALAGAAEGKEAERPSPIVRLTAHHVVYSVANVDTLAAWYVRVLGFRITKRFHVGGVEIAWLDIPGFRLGFMQFPKSRPPAAVGAVPARGVRNLVFSVADVDAAVRDLTAAGARIANPPQTSHPPDIRTANLLDPEGNVIGLYQDLNPANALLPAGRTGDDRR